MARPKRFELLTPRFVVWWRAENGGVSAGKLLRAQNLFDSRPIFGASPALSTASQALELPTAWPGGVRWATSRASGYFLNGEPSIPLEPAASLEKSTALSCDTNAVLHPCCMEKIAPSRNSLKCLDFIVTHGMEERRLRRQSMPGSAISASIMLSWLGQDDLTRFCRHCDCEEPCDEAIQLPALPSGLLRGVYHRARIRATRWRR